MAKTFEPGLFASILCWMANVDKRITFSELRMMRRILTERCGLREPVAKLILEVAFVIDVSELQLSELVSSLAKSTKQKERNEFFAELSRLVTIDNKIMPEEIECLRTVALYLRVSERTWIGMMTDMNKRIETAESRKPQAGSRKRVSRSKK